MKTRFLIIIACTAALLTGCGGDSSNQQREPVAVEVDQVVTALDGKDFAYSGTIEESETIPLSFSLVGTVSRVYVKEGDHVRKGDLLAELNPVTYQNSYQMTAAAEKQAEDAYNRLVPMYNNKTLPEIKYVEVKTALEQARAAAAIARKNLDDCKLASPVDGIVGKRSLEPGMVAAPNLSSITVVKIAKVFARIAVSENEIASIEKGRHATVRAGALGNRSFAGTVEEIGVVADPVAHTYKIKVGLRNDNLLLKPGMVCAVSLAADGGGSACVAPHRAVMTDERGATYVYAVDASSTKAVRKGVKTGRLLNHGIEIVEGLVPGERVVVEGQQKLADGSILRIVNASN